MLQGKHLLIDMYGVAGEILSNRALLLSTLNKVIAIAGLHSVAEPTIVQFNTRGHGMTGFVPLAESHIAFHTYPEFGYIAIDVFTCGPTEIGAVQGIFEEALSPKRLVNRLCFRGEPDTIGQ